MADNVAHAVASPSESALKLRGEREKSDGKGSCNAAAMSHSSNVSCVLLAGESPVLRQLDKQLQELISDLIETAEFKGKQVYTSLLSFHS